MNTEQLRFADKMLQCKNCGAQFVFTVHEQREIARSDPTAPEPELCPACRQKGSPTTVIGGKQRGKVKWFNRRRGYGFIVVEGSAEEIFVHRTDLEGIHNLRKGQAVEFEIESTPKGPEAIRVSPLKVEA